MSAASSHKHAWRVQTALTQSGHVVTLVVSGRLGTDGAEELRRTLATAHDCKDRLLLDLEHVDYVSSAGIAVLQDAARARHEAGGALELTRASELVRLALRLAGPIPYLETSESGGEGTT